MHLGTALYSIDNSVHHCKFTGCIWDAQRFQMIFADEFGRLSMWSSLNERFLNHVLLPIDRQKRNVASNSVNTVDALSGTIVPYKKNGCMFSLLPSSGRVVLWEVFTAHYYC
jgi:hypothetical protein